MSRIEGSAEPTSVGATERPVERLVFFTDAVVAIALTLLILPLLEGVSEAARAGLTTVEYLEESDGQLLSFVLSFLVIITFWVQHHGLYQRIAHYNAALLWLNVGWMLTIVWLPVATALAGSMASDPLQEVLYIGTMLLSSLALTAANLVARRNPELWPEQGRPAAGGLAANIALTILYAVALLLALLVPGLNYLALFALLLTPVLQRLIASRLRAS